MTRIGLIVADLKSVFARFASFVVLKWLPRMMRMNANVTWTGLHKVAVIVSWDIRV